MIPTTHHHIVLAQRPIGEPAENDFRLEEVTTALPGPGEVLVRVLYLSLDPYMRGRMRDAASYAPPVGIGDVMTGGAVAEVVASHNAEFSVGDIVEGRFGWQEYALGSTSSMRKIDPTLAPISTANGILGMPGMTAYCGLFEIGTPKVGETVVVSAASGAVGQVVGQLAKHAGCHVVGIAGAQRNARSCATNSDLTTVSTTKPKPSWSKPSLPPVPTA
jgi:NADPH-dependent curcumin reductase CurA